MKWQDKLTKKELKHLRQTDITTLRAVKENAEYQKEQREKTGILQCPKCWDINIKLGLSV